MPNHSSSLVRGALSEAGILALGTTAASSVPRPAGRYAEKHTGAQFDHSQKAAFAV